MTLREPDLPPDDDTSLDYWSINNALPVESVIEPLPDAVIYALFPKLPEDKRVKVRRDYKRLRKRYTLTTATARRATALAIVHYFASTL